MLLTGLIQLVLKSGAAAAGVLSQELLELPLVLGSIRLELLLLRLKSIHLLAFSDPLLRTHDHLLEAHERRRLSFGA